MNYSTTRGESLSIERLLLSIAIEEASLAARLAEASIEADRDVERGSIEIDDATRALDRALVAIANDDDDDDVTDARYLVSTIRDDLDALSIARRTRRDTRRDARVALDNAIRAARVARFDLPSLSIVFESGSSLDALRDDVSDDDVVAIGSLLAGEIATSL